MIRLWVKDQRSRSLDGGIQGSTLCKARHCASSSHYLVGS